MSTKWGCACPNCDREKTGKRSSNAVKEDQLHSETLSTAGVKKTKERGPDPSNPALAHLHLTQRENFGNHSTVIGVIIKGGDAYFLSRRSTSHHPQRDQKKISPVQHIRIDFLAKGRKGEKKLLGRERKRTRKRSRRQKKR